MPHLLGIIFTQDQGVSVYMCACLDCSGTCYSNVTFWGIQRPAVATLYATQSLRDTIVSATPIHTPAYVRIYMYIGVKEVPRIHRAVTKVHVSCL